MDSTELSDIVGDEIVAIRRVLFMVNETPVLAAEGPLQLTMHNSGDVWFDAGHDGEILKVVRSTWVDHFAEPLSAANREYVAQSGKWTSFDLSNDALYSNVVASFPDA